MHGMTGIGSTTGVAEYTDCPSCELLLPYRFKILVRCLIARYIKSIIIIS